MPMKSRFLLTVFFLALTTVFAMAQDRVITGTVTAADDGSKLPGVSIIVKGTTTGTVTNTEGTYSLKVPGDATTLIYSYVGYVKKEVALGGSNVINVSLVAGVALDEVVVTAIGLPSDKKRLSYSVQRVDAEEVVQAQRTNVVQALSGQAAGIQVNGSNGSPGSSAAIRIRGNASLTGNNAPLFVIDGVPVDNTESPSGNPNDLANQRLYGVNNSNRAIDINPNDIENVTVLKGGAATTLYGIRAANGVVLITTKKGADTGGKLQVTYNTNFVASQHNGLPPQQTTYAQGSGGVYSAPGYVGFAPNDTINIGGRDRHSWGPAVADLRYQQGTAGRYFWDKNGRLVHKDHPQASGTPANTYDNTGDFFQTGWTYDNNLSMRAGTAKNNVYFSVGNRKQNGIVPNSEFERTSFKVTAQSQMTSKLRATLQANYVNSGGNRMQQGSNLSGVMLGLMRTPVTFDNSNGLGADAVDNPEAYYLPDGSQRGYRGASNFGGRSLYAIYDNPFFTVSQNSLRDRVNRVLGFAQLDYEINDWLSVMYRLGTDFYNDRKKTIMEIGSLDLGNGEGFIAEDQITNQDINSDLIFTVNKSFGDIDLQARFGHNYYQKKFQRYYSQGVDLTIPGFYHLSNTVTQTINNANTNKQTQGAYVDANIGFKDFLFVSGTFRSEQSSTLPTDNNNFTSYSAGLGLVLTEMLDIKNDVLSFAKIRASYSKMGNDAPAYVTSTIFNPTPAPGDGWTNGLTFPFGGVSAASKGNTLGNPNLSAETLISTEFGIDMRLFKDRIGIDFAYYNNSSQDLILAVPIAASSGYRAAVLNAGEMSNKGIELTISGTPIKTKDFAWNINFNFTQNKSEVEALADGVDVITLVGFASTSSRAIVGQGYGAIYGQTWAAINDEELKDDFSNRLIGADGFPSLKNDAVFLGDPNPDWIMGITNGFTYKGLNFSFLWDIKQGGSIWNGTRGALTTMGTAEGTEDRGKEIVFEGVTADGNPNQQSVVVDEGWYRGTGGGFSGNAIDFVEETSWIRLRNVSLAYSLSDKMIDRLPIKGLTLSVTAVNLLLITDYQGVDPETSLTGSGNGTGALDYFNPPGIKSWAFGLKLDL